MGNVLLDAPAVSATGSEIELEVRCWHTPLFHSPAVKLAAVLLRAHCGHTDA